MPFLILFWIMFAFLFLVALLVFLFVLIRDSLLNRIPFVSTRRHAVPCILQALQIKDNSVCYDLGCGNACVLRALRAKHGGARLIGYERGILPLTLARLLSIGKEIDIRYGDMFSVDVSDASHIYVYTGTEAMKCFEVKLFSECAPGTRIVSLDFVFPNKQFIEHYPLLGGRFALAKDVYVYVV